MFPNTTTALRIFVSLPASVASSERTFNVLKQVKNYHGSTMRQDRLNGFIKLSTDLARKLDFTQKLLHFQIKKC
jgi:hypothetical protein